MLSVKELEKLKDKDIYETPDGGSYIAETGKLPDKVTNPYFDRKDLPNMEDTINLTLPAEILIPRELQIVLDQNALAQNIAFKDAEIATLRKELLLSKRYQLVLEFAAKNSLNLNLYDLVDDLEKGFKFVLKEVRANDSPPSN